MAGKEKEAAYIPVNGNYLPPVPYSIDGKFNCFVFESSREKLQEICDRWFEGSSERVKPLWNDAIILFADYKRDGPITPSYAALGYAAYKEALLMMFVYRRKKKWYGYAKEKFAFVPYIFLDQPQAISAGREIYGLPKTWGEVCMPEQPEKKPDYFSLSGPAVLTDDSTASGPDYKIWEIEGRGFNAAAPLLFFSKIFALIKDLLRAPQGRGLIALGLKLISVVFTKTIPLIALRQYRDIGEGSSVCYKSIIKYSATIRKVRHIGLLPGRFSLRNKKHPLYPVTEDLGLKETGNTCKATFWIDFNFSFNEGEELQRF